MSDLYEKYQPLDIEGALAHLVEECGEVVAAAGKSLRFGLRSCNPEPGASREANGDWLERELVDLERAIAWLRDDVEMEDYAERRGPKDEHPIPTSLDDVAPRIRRSDDRRGNPRR